MIHLLSNLFQTDLPTSMSSYIYLIQMFNTLPESSKIRAARQCKQVMSLDLSVNILHASELNSHETEKIGLDAALSRPVAHKCVTWKDQPPTQLCWICHSNKVIMEQCSNNTILEQRKRKVELFQMFFAKRHFEEFTSFVRKKVKFSMENVKTTIILKSPDLLHVLESWQKKQLNYFIYV